MQQYIGELIRQLRREHNITQSELGSGHYSKSYVSAVERNKILPSLEALRFFATQLNYPNDYFTSLFQGVNGQKQLAVQADPDNIEANAHSLQEETISLLDILLKSTDLHNLPPLHELPALSSEVFAALQPDKQARYYYVVTIIALWEFTGKRACTTKMRMCWCIQNMICELRDVYTANWAIVYTLLSTSEPFFPFLKRGVLLSMRWSRNSSVLSVFLLQSRTLYQVSGDRPGERRSRLFQALAFLHLSSRNQYRLQKASSNGVMPFPYTPTALDEAEEQCRQILMTWQGQHEAVSALSTEQEVDFYQAMAYLVCIYAQRAFLARLSGHKDIAHYERSVAVYFCEQILRALSDQSLPFHLLVDVLSPRNSGYQSPTPSQLRLPPEIERHEQLLHSPVTYIEVCFAVSEAAEELGHAADDSDYAHYCYDHATRALEAALSLSTSLQTDQHNELLEPNYSRWCYQRSVSFLEERNLVAPEYADETNKVLVKILTQAFHHASLS